MLNDSQTLYDLLDITPDASPQEVREAYLRTKTTYNRDNLVLYTLVSSEEREDALSKVEEAYLILSDPDKRRAYDLNHGLFIPGDNPFAGVGTSADVVSIDRVPPMENLFDGENLLIPPKTDFQEKKEHGSSGNTPPPSSDDQSGFDDSPIRPLESTQDFHLPTEGSSHSHKPPVGSAHHNQNNNRPGQLKLDSALLQEIEGEKEWMGSFLKKVRESYQISIEEMSAITKISKTYLQAIEDENFPKLPASVYVRGFVIQFAKTLKLPHETVANAYLTRYKAAQATSKE